jgi:hypothetical protein
LLISEIYCFVGYQENKKNVQQFIGLMLAALIPESIE